ncbi:MAG: DUF885 family protein, partial [Stackebrandtia sp.]
MREIDEIADGYVDEALALSPVTATYMGVSGHDHELDDLSPRGAEAAAELDRRTLAKLNAAEPSDERERVAKEGMVERLSLQLERHEAGDEYLNLNVITSAIHNVRQVFDMMSTEGQD